MEKYISRKEIDSKLEYYAKFVKGTPMFRSELEEEHEILANRLADITKSIIHQEQEIGNLRLDLEKQKVKMKGMAVLGSICFLYLVLFNFM